MSKAQSKTYLDQIESGNVKTKRALILSLLMTGNKMTLEQICESTGLPEKTAVGRISELMDMGLVYVHSIVESMEKRTVSRFAFEQNEELRIVHHNNRKQKRFERWFKKGKQMFPEYLDKYTANNLIK